MIHPPAALGVAFLLAVACFTSVAFQSGAFETGGFPTVLHQSEEKIIHYSASDDLSDPITKLQHRLSTAGTRLAFEPAHGYLISILQALDIPVSSQSLVFSKTSLNNDHTSPQTPRAVYFGDDAYISWVSGGDSIDISAVDPQKGPIFYTLEQRETSQPHFERRRECTGCHIGPKTLNVPGHLLRSVITAPDGSPLSQLNGFTIGHGSPLDQRWGGWYVTAVNDRTTHVGNSFARDRDHPEDFQPSGSLADLQDRVDISRYLSSGSDMAALLVLAHQVKMHNLITRANYETHYALAEQKPEQKAEQNSRTQLRIEQVAEPLLEYMLFRDEVPLQNPIQGTSTFAHDFEQRGPRDSKGRSLRELDLKTRLLRYPCSYLIYSEAFDSLPQPLKDYLWQRLARILEGHDQRPPYFGMAETDRKAVFEILRDTKPEFAAATKRTN